jgi:hypothetical protein
MNQSGGDVANVTGIDFFYGFVARVDFKESPLGLRSVEMREAEADGGGALLRDADACTFDHSAVRESFATVFEP